VRRIITLIFLVSMGSHGVAADPITFTKADLDKVPTGWKVARTGTGEGSVWKVVEDKSAPSRSGFALAQAAESPGTMFNLCVAEGTSFKDVEISISFKANAGKKDQGGGVVWRYQDANNYYIARMNPLEDNFRVYKVVNGKRSAEFQNAEVKIPAGEWHTLSAKMVGDAIECSVDGKKYLEAKDDAFTKAGKVGLWTKADARTSFDNILVKEVK
jgi:3-keto-disaccharide hydrolase